MYIYFLCNQFIILQIQGNLNNSNAFVINNSFNMGTLLDCTACARFQYNQLQLTSSTHRYFPYIRHFPSKLEEK